MSCVVELARMCRGGGYGESDDGCDGNDVEWVWNPDSVALEGEDPECEGRKRVSWTREVKGRGTVGGTPCRGRSCIMANKYTQKRHREARTCESSARISTSGEGLMGNLMAYVCTHTENVGLDHLTASISMSPLVFFVWAAASPGFA